MYVYLYIYIYIYIYHRYTYIYVGGAYIAFHSRGLGLWELTIPLITLVKLTLTVRLKL